MIDKLRKNETAGVLGGLGLIFALVILTAWAIQAGVLR